MKGLRTIVALGTLYAVALLVGFGLFVIAFKAGVLRTIDILFYRGIVLAAVSSVLTFGVLAVVVRGRSIAGLGPRDAFAAAVLSLSLNLTFLIVVPVTVDRSISIFMLDQMAAEPDVAFTAADMTARFSRIYLGERQQIARRLHEQEVSGNVRRDGDGFKITPHGSAVIAVARIVADLFDSHAGILAGAPKSELEATPSRQSRR